MRTPLIIEDSGEQNPYSTRATTLGELDTSEFRDDFSFSARAVLLVGGETKPNSYVLRANDIISAQVAATSKSI